MTCFFLVFSICANFHLLVSMRSLTVFQVFKLTMAGSVEVSISIDEAFIHANLSPQSMPLEFDMTHRYNCECLGFVRIIEKPQVDLPQINLASGKSQSTSRKRALSAKVEPSSKISKSQPPSSSSASGKSLNAFANDLETLNLIPEMSNSDLSCKVCSYVATKKSNLKVHYQLKHLGGAGLIMKCQICGTTVKTKAYIKKHYMSVHNLTESAAQNMANSS